MIEKTLIKDLSVNDTVETYFSVKYKHPVREYRNGFMFTSGVSDRSGEIEVVYWGMRDEERVRGVYESFEVGDVILVKGKVSVFNEKTKIDVNEGLGEIRKCAPGEYDMGEFIPVTNQDVDSLWSYLVGIKDSMEDPGLKALLESFFDDQDFVTAFKKAPGAMYYHHACIGGLLEHTWGVLLILETVHRIHPSLDHDLMMAGGILHDIGKMKEFEVTTNIKVSEVGMLRGHISLGEEMVRERITAIGGLQEPLESKLLHIIISHHGKGENGSPKDPQFPEAVAVHYADLFDSQLTQYIRAKKDASTEDFRTYIKRLGEIYLR